MKIGVKVKSLENFSSLLLNLLRGGQGRIYSKPGPVQKKMWGPQVPNTIIGLVAYCYRLQFPV